MRSHGNLIFNISPTEGVTGIRSGKGLELSGGWVADTLLTLAARVNGTYEP